MDVPTSTIILTWAPQSLNYIWDSVTGFFYSAGGAQFTIVVIILIGVICLIVAGIKSIFPTWGKKL